MSTPHIDDDQLQRYFDGELPPAEAEAVRRAVEASDHERGRLEKLERLRALVRMAAQDMSTDVAADELYARVETDLSAQGRRKGLEVLRGGRSRTRRRVIVATVVTLAAAAAVAFALLRGRPGTGPAPVAHERVHHRTPALIAANGRHGHSGRAPGPEEGSEVVEVDFGRNTGTVFNVQGSSGQPIAVVWIDEQQEQVQ